MGPGRRALGARGSSRKAAGDKKMRASGLIGFNALALAAFATPAFLMFAQAGPTLAGNPAWAGLSLVSMLAGCVSVFVSMLRLSNTGRSDLTFATLLIAGLVLVALPVAGFVAVGPFG
jgi:hypothetical protein